MSLPKIGIVSGIGPLAGADILQRLLALSATKYKAVEDHEYPEIVLVSHGIKGVGNTADLQDSFESELMASVDQLASLDVTIIGIACNTAHAYLPQLEHAYPGVVFINLLQCVAGVAGQLVQKFALLSSASTVKNQLYDDYLASAGVEYSFVNDTQQKTLDAVIAAIMAHNLTHASELMQSLLSELQEEGYENIIAGCTELPIAISATDIQSMKVIDSNQILAESLAAAYYSQLTSV